jgi:outer membrane immunogenic protein
MSRTHLHSTLVAGALVAGSSIYASAADLPARAPAYKAPPVTVDYWTGFYVGVHAGYGWGTKDWLNSDNGGFFEGRGFLGGGQIGVNQQVGNGWVLGIEADASWSGFKGNQTTERGAIPVDFYVTESLESKIDWMASVALRAGIAVDRLLVYGKFGIAIAHEHHSANWYRNVGGAIASYAVSGSETRTGTLVGFGAEYAWSDYWSAKIEYNYVPFVDKPIELAGTQTDAGVTTPLWYNQRIGQSLHFVKAGVNYRLGQAAPSAVAPARTTGYDWSGFYLGAQAGHGWGRTTWASFRPDQSYDVAGWLAGGQVGVNAQSGRIVVGVEAEGLWTNAGGSLDGSFTVDVSGPSRDTLATRVNWLGMVSGRLGYAVADRWLVYGKGGVAFANERHDFTRTFPAGPGFEIRESATRLRSGWLAGVGIEHAIAGNWSVKAEYVYIDFQDKSETLSGVVINGPVTPAAQNFEIRQWMQLVKFGLNYRFGAQPAAVVAKY